MTPEPDATEVSWSQFVGALAAVVPGLDPTKVDPDTTLAQVVPGATQRSMLRTAVAKLGRGLPSDLIETIDTLGEAHAWCAKSWEGRTFVDPRHAAPDDEVEGSGVALRPVLPEHLPLLYRSALDPASGPRWRFRGATPSIEQFTRSLYEGTLAQYLVTHRDTGVICGLVALYSARFDAGTCSIAYTRVGDRRGGGEMLLGMFHLIEHAFQQWDLRKIYAEVPGYNEELIDGLVGSLVDVEGRFRDHEYAFGRWWDLTTVAIWRDRWEAYAELWRTYLSAPVPVVARG